MALIDVSVNQADQARFEQMFRRLQRELSLQGRQNHLRRDIQPVMRERIAERFEGEGDSTVGMWAPLTEATENIREWLGFGREHPINERTGRLRHFVENSFEIKPLGQTAELVMPGKFSNEEIENKFRKAQQGKTRSRRKDAIVTVPRPVVAIGQVENDLATTQTRMWIDRILRSL